MPVQLVTDFRHLYRLAKELGEAKRSGDPVRIAEAQQNHDAYKELCLKADVMVTGLSYGDL